MPENQTVLIAIIAALPGLLVGVVSLYVAIKKNGHDIAKTDAETEKVKAETDDLHSQIADRWAEHVSELQAEVMGMRVELVELRRENEYYRAELIHRDAIIDDLKNWSERLTTQLQEHAPNVVPAKFYRKGLNRNPMENV